MKQNKNLLFVFVFGLSLVTILVGCIEPDRKLTIAPANMALVPLPVAAVESGSGSDPRLNDQWALNKIGMPEVWRTLPTPGTRRVTVALVGSGVDYNHEDLHANIGLNPVEGTLKKPADSSPMDGKDDDQNGFVDDWVGWDVLEEGSARGLPFDRLGSGTAAAGIIGALQNNGKGVRGINAQVSLVPVRYIDDNGNGKIPNLVKALQYTVARLPDVVFVHLANLDFAQGVRDADDKKEIQKIEEESLVEVLEKLRKKNIPVVVSAGNLGADVGKSKSVVKKLSQLENVLVVTSVNASDQRPFIANYGMQVVGTAAPGEEVLSTLPGNRYGKVSGTYIAAAHVAGALALAVSRHYGRRTVKDYFKALLSEAGSDPLPAMEMESIGGNRLNIARFLAALE